MTNSEAIQILKQYLDMDSEVKSEYLEAQRMAIKALEQHPNRCDSCAHSEEQDGSNCYECVKGMADNFEAQQTEMRDATEEERKSVKDYVKSISKPTGFNYFEAQPTDADCISRKRLLARIDEERKHLLDIKMDGAEHIIVHHARRIIENMPSVTPKQTKWIPVSEMLPEDNIHVLCQFYLGGMGECYLAHGVFHVVGGVVMTCNEVIAWMPLPEPYRSESE